MNREIIVLNDNLNTAVTVDQLIKALEKHRNKKIVVSGNAKIGLLVTDDAVSVDSAEYLQEIAEELG